uniref:Uncharacterized protein n=1 Tax=Brassica oleracea TaxID=3712 RepID=A0A3P6C720_BRAOL|nr:unnamed protein product [Brassica oleracea]
MPFLLLRRLIKRSIDPPESRYVSPKGSPFKLDNPKAIVTDGKFPPLLPPPPPQLAPRNQRSARGAPTNSSSEKSPSSVVVFNRWVREKGLQTTTRKVGGGESEETSSGHVVGNQAKDRSPKSLVKDR